MKNLIAVVFLALVIFLGQNLGATIGRSKKVSPCRRVLMEQSKAERGCTPDEIGIIRDELRAIHDVGGDYASVYRLWVEERTHVFNTNIDMDVLRHSRACNKMMCFKMVVEGYVKQPNYRVPMHCQWKTPKQYLEESLDLKEKKMWTADDMMTVFCAKANNPDFHLH